MTRKLIDSILTICLLFGSLYLSAHAAEASKTTITETQPITRKVPEDHFSEGVQCLEQANPACASLALANIPSLSPYAKLLQGAIALSHHRIDDAMRLLLPLQAEKNLTSEASVILHQQLASSFESVDDAPQAVAHLMQAKDAAATLTPLKLQIKTDAIQQKIWGLLNQQNKGQLIAMRGDSTDNDLQGWIDLSLAARNQDRSTSIASWSINYPDHSAAAFAKTLSNHPSAGQAKISLPTNGAIALILPLALPLDETDAAKAAAFKQGLLTALGMHEMPNEVKVYDSTGTVESIAEQYTAARNEGAAYFIAANFNHVESQSNQTPPENLQNILHLGLFLNDEAHRISNFAASHAIQRIVMITSEDEASKQMAASFRSAWQPDTNAIEQNNPLYTITLPIALNASDANLLDLKTQISAYSPDMLILALPSHEARIVRPHISVSIPTMAFSNVHEIAKSNDLLNAVRFVDIPFLLQPDKAPFKTYHNANNHQESHALSRWFALGADAPQLLIAQLNSGNETIISGLTGMLTIDKSGNLHRELSVARFTFSEVEIEK